MSENTPDNAMDTSDYDNGDAEPSMEDILASIRQIIADDKSDDIVDVVADVAALGSAPVVEIQEPAISLVVNSSEPENIAPEATETTQPEILPSETLQSETLPLGTSSAIAGADEADIHDLLNFVDEASSEEAPVSATVESFTAALPVVDVVSAAASGVAPAAMGFDETLDLVMDTDASDYLTTIVEPKPDTVNQVEDDFGGLVDVEFSDEDHKTSQSSKLVRPRPVVAMDELVDLVVGDEDLIIPEVSGTAVAVSVTPAIGGEGAIGADASNPVGQEAVEVLGAPSFENNLAELEIKAADDELENVVDSVPASQEPVLRATPDEDIDLVKSLLADLMDEPTEQDVENVETEAEENTQIGLQSPSLSGASEPVPYKSGPFEDGPSDFIDDGFFVGEEKTDPVLENTEASVLNENILDDVLHKSIEDEVALHEEMVALQTAPKAEAVAPESIVPQVDVDSDDLATLTSLLDEIDMPDDAALEDESSELADTNADDLVVLKQPDMAEHLSLVATTGAILTGATLTGAALLLNKGEVDASNTDAVLQKPNNVGDDDPIVEKQPNQAGADFTELETLDIRKENETMAQAAKTGSILDVNTERDSSDAFASLTSAVKEKADFAERGPAIGDFVQEALRPMLKEWLDANLKGIVERAVTKEVKRISSGK